MADLSSLEAAETVKLVGSDINGAETTPVKVKSNQDLCVNDILNNSFITAEKTANSTASIARVGVSNLINRKVVEIVNTSNIVIYVGSSTVTSTGATRGRPIEPKANYVMALDSQIDLYIVSPSSATYVVVEAS